MHPPISAADLLRAFHAIEPESDEERRTIAAMLGLDWRTIEKRRRRPKPAKPEPPISTPDTTTPTATPATPTPQRTEQHRRSAGSDVRISKPRRVRAPQPSWLKAGPALAEGTLGRAHSPAPLFRPQWTRAILAASLSARRPIGPPDLTRAVEVIARGQALHALPRQPILTLARGVQALIDIGENMEPFAQDRAVLRRDLKRIVGDGSLEILECAGSPRKTRRDDRPRTWLDYETRFPPQLDACVLVVSDFGIGGGLSLARGASSYDWAMLARRLAHSGHRVVGFVPYPPARWPAYLARAVDLVPWDRATTAGRISLKRARSATA